MDARLDGELESPRPGAVVRVLALRGRLRGLKAGVQRLVLKRAGAADVALAVAADGRFDATVALAWDERGPIALELWADLDGGERVRAFSLEVSGDPPPEARPSALRFARTAAHKAWAALREGRLPLSPSAWLRDLKLHWAELADRPPIAEAESSSRRAVEAACKTALASFLDGNRRLALPTSEAPELSILIVAYQRAELLLRCLESLATSKPFEVIVIDNASSDATPALLARVDGARIVCETRNTGFPAAVNRAAKMARGRTLLLLNHDAAPAPGAIDAALAALTGDVGAVGARLVLSDGRLQEAGCAIRADGSCVGIGRGAPAEAPEHMFRRDADFCSGAFLLTPRALFEELGGLDEGYGPAYYEEVDYCVRLWKHGRRVLYEPDALVEHFEFASTPSAAEAQRMQAERRARFFASHRDWLAKPRTRRNLRILVIDDRIPEAHLGSGWPRMQSLIAALAESHAVTLFPTVRSDLDWPSIRRALPATVEVMRGCDASDLGRFVTTRGFDRIVVSRPNNLRTLRARIPWPPPGLIYDGESLFAERAAQERALRGEADRAADEKARADELALARGARAILAVSEAERARFATIAPSHVVGHALVPSPTPAPFASRSGLLFVGAFHREDSPNSDALRWFLDEIWPAVRAELGAIRLTVVGERPPAAARALASPDVDLFERVADLTPLYDRARLFVAPTRIAAGLPYKIHHAAAHGLPVVCTQHLLAQLGWRDRLEASAAADAREFAARVIALYRDEALWQKLRDGALAAVARDCSPRAFRDALAEALR
jgi:GT2 family glycosyltransferase